LLPPLPQARTPPVSIASSTSIPVNVRQPERFLKLPKNRRNANAALPAAYHGLPGRLGITAALVVAAVVEIVSVAVAAATPFTTTGVVVPKLKVGAYCAPLGLDVTAAVSATLPVNPPSGVTVIVELFPVVAPGAIVTAGPLNVKLGGVVTASAAVPEPLS
jgi:hypothetical protein